MALTNKTILNPAYQMWNIGTYDDQLAAGAALETTDESIEYNLYAVISQLNRAFSGVVTGNNWYVDTVTPTGLGDTGTQRGVNNLNTDLHLIERKRILKRVSMVDVDVPDPVNAQVVILGAGDLPSTTTLALGSTTLGTVAATASTFGTASLDEVAGANPLQPKSMLVLTDVATGDVVVGVISGKQVYGLFQSESAVDQSTITATTPNRIQISFVVHNAGNNDLELAPAGDMNGIVFDYAYVRRDAFEDCPEEAWLGDGFADTGVSAATRQAVYDNQGATVVDTTTNATLDVGLGLTWEIGDGTSAPLFTVTEGSGGGTTDISIGTAVDTYMNMAVDVDFTSGITANTADAINIGTTTDQIDFTGNATITSTNTNSVTVTASNASATLSTTGAAGNVVLSSVGNVDVDGGSITLDATLGFSLDAVGAASNVTADSNNLTLETTTSGTLVVSSAGILDMDGASAVTIDSPGGISVDAGASSNFTAAGTLQLQAITAGDIDIDAVDDVTIDGDCIISTVSVQDTGTIVQDSLFNYFQSGNLIATAARITDTYHTLNAEYALSTSVTGGTVVIRNASTTTGGNITDFVAGVDASSDASFTPSAATGLIAGQLIMIVGADDCENNGIFEVETASGTSPFTVTVSGMSNTKSERFSKFQFVAATGQTATAYVVTVCVMRCSTTGAWEVADGASVPLSYTELGTTAGSTLQAAYVASAPNTPSISVTSANGSLEFANDATADTTTVLEVNREPGASTGGLGLDVNFNANTTGNAFDVSHAGSGIAVNVLASGSGDAFFSNNTGTGATFTLQTSSADVMDVDANGAFLFTPPSTQDFTITGSGAGSAFLTDGFESGTLQADSGTATAGTVTLQANNSSTGDATIIINSTATTGASAVNVATANDQDVTIGVTGGDASLDLNAGTGNLSADASAAVAGGAVSSTLASTNTSDTASAEADASLTATATGGTAATIAITDVYAATTSASGDSTLNLQSASADNGTSITNISTGTNVVSNTVNVITGTGVPNALSVGTADSTTTASFTTGSSTVDMTDTGVETNYQYELADLATAVDRDAATVPSRERHETSFFSIENSTEGNTAFFSGTGNSSGTATNNYQVSVVTTDTPDTITSITNNGAASNVTAVTSGSNTYATGEVVQIFNDGTINPANAGLWVVVSQVGSALTLDATPGTGFEFFNQQAVTQSSLTTPIRRATITAMRIDTTGEVLVARNFNDIGTASYVNIVTGGGTLEAAWAGNTGTATTLNTSFTGRITDNDTYLVESETGNHTLISLAAVAGADVVTIGENTDANVVNLAAGTGGVNADTSGNIDLNSAALVTSTGATGATFEADGSTAGTITNTIQAVNSDATAASAAVVSILANEDSGGANATVATVNINATSNSTGGVNTLNLQATDDGTVNLATSGSGNNTVNIATASGVDNVVAVGNDGTGTTIDFTAASTAVGIHAREWIITNTFLDRNGASAPAVMRREATLNAFENGSEGGLTIYRGTGYTTASGTSTYEVTVVSGSATTDTATAITNNGAATNPTVTTTGTGTFATGAYVMFTAGVSELNRGHIYEVINHTGNTCTFAATNSAGSEWCANQVFTESSITGTMTQLGAVSVLRVDSSGDYAIAEGATDAGTITYTDLGATAATLENAWANNTGTATTLNTNFTGRITDADVYTIETETGNHTLISLAAVAGADVVTIGTTDSANVVDINSGTGGTLIDSTGVVSIDCSGAANFTSDSGSLTVSTTTSGNLIVDAVDSLDMDAGAAADLTTGTTISLNAGSSMALDSGTTMALTATTTLTLDTDDAADASANTLTLATGNSTAGGADGPIIIMAPGDGNAGGVHGYVNITGAFDNDESFIELDGTGGSGNSNIYAGATAPTHTAPGGSFFLLNDGTSATGNTIYVQVDASGVGDNGSDWQPVVTTDTAVTRIFFQDTMANTVSPGSTITTSDVTGASLPSRPSAAAGFSWELDAQVFLNGVLLMNTTSTTTNEVDEATGNATDIVVESSGPAFSSGDVITIVYFTNSTS